MISRKILGLFFLIFNFCQLAAQEPNLRIRRFDDAPELSNIGIYDILQDKTGFIWLATDAGLCRFDGRSFKIFHNLPGDSTSLTNNNILNIEEDAAGDIWLALARGGVSRYDRGAGRFQNFTFTRRLDPSTTPVHAVFLDRDGQLWASIGEKGLARVDKKTGNFEQFDIVTRQTSPYFDAAEVGWANQAYDFWQDPQGGKIWMTTRDGFYVLDPKTGRCEPRRSQNFKGAKKQEFNTWRFCPDGDLLWAGGWESGLQCVNRRTGEQKQFFYNPNPPEKRVTNIVNGIVKKDEDELWIATNDRGLGIFNKKTGQFRFFDGMEERLATLSKGAGGSIICDRQGSIWMNLNGVLTQIILENSLFRFQKISENNDIATISQMFEDREGRFFFTAIHAGDGLRVLEKKSGRQVTLDFKNPLGVEKITMAKNVRQAPDGTVWLMTHHEIYRFDPSKMRLEKTAQPKIFSPDGLSNYYTEFEIDPQGRLWMGTSTNGIILFDPKTGETKQFLPDKNDPNSIPTNVVGVIAMDRQGRCWFGSRDRTCYGYFLENENRFVRLDPNGQPTPDRASQRTNSISVDRKGNVWACSEAGLLKFDCAAGLPVFSKKYTVADGLPSDYTFQLEEDAAGNLWGFARGQLYRLDPKTDKIALFGKREGFDFLATQDIFAAQDGSMYVFGTGRVAKFDPLTVEPIKPTVRLALTSFRVDDREQFSGSEPLPSGPLVATADSRYFSLEFAALDFAAPESHEFEYFFEGFDNQWIRSGTRRVFSFTNVPAGHYFFKIKLAGAPDSEAIAVPLRVEVAFYKTGWFWALVLAMAAGAVFRFFQLRQRQKQQVQELKSKTQLLEKEKAVVMYESLKQQLNPHFLFNSLTSLGSLIQIDPKSAARFLENLSKTYRYILKSSERETVPLGEELKFAEAFMRLQKTRFEQGLEVNFGVPEEFFHRKIVPVTLQNLLENAIKHNIIDEESPLVIEVFIDDDCLTVRNNLQRKSFVETSNRKGLANLQSFYRYLSDRPIEMSEDGAFFVIKIPLI